MIHDIIPTVRMRIRILTLIFCPHNVCSLSYPVAPVPLQVPVDEREHGHNDIEYCKSSDYASVILIRGVRSFLRGTPSP